MLSTVVFFDAFADHLKLSIGLDEASCSSRRSYPYFIAFSYMDRLGHQSLLYLKYTAY